MRKMKKKVSKIQKKMIFDLKNSVKYETLVEIDYYRDFTYWYTKKSDEFENSKSENVCSKFRGHTKIIKSYTQIWV